jgi:hypothetical protein
MKIPEITFMHSEGGDWVALYSDGDKIDEGHSLTPEMVLEALEIPFTSIEVKVDEYGEADFPDILEKAAA